MPKIKLVNAFAAPWKDTYSIFGLDSKGILYRLDRAKTCSGWIPLNMEIAKCVHEHRESSLFSKKKIQAAEAKILPQSFRSNLAELSLLVPGRKRLFERALQPPKP